MSNKKKAIICVDDDTIILNSIKFQLTQSFGKEYVIEVAESGEEALDIIDYLLTRGIQTSLVITDWLMPQMKGDHLLVEIHNKYPHIASIMLSGQADQEAVENAFKKAKMRAFLMKPWSREELLGEVNALLMK